MIYISYNVLCSHKSSSIQDELGLRATYITKPRLCFCPCFPFYLHLVAHQCQLRFYVCFCFSAFCICNFCFSEEERCMHVCMSNAPALLKTHTHTHNHKTVQAAGHWLGGRGGMTVTPPQRVITTVGHDPNIRGVTVFLFFYLLKTTLSVSTSLFFFFFDLPMSTLSVSASLLLSFLLQIRWRSPLCAHLW